jgi:hypothetical protein
MAREICDDSTKADWTAWAYREYRRLLDVEMMAVCQIYAEIKLADLPVREGKEARGWLTSAHRDVECAREHIGMRIGGAGEHRALLHPPKRRYSHHQQQKRRARVAMFYEARGAGAMSRRQAQDAVDRARLQASRTSEAATEPPGSEPGGVSFKGPREGKEEAVAQRAFVGGLPRAALRQVRRHAAIIAWMRGIVSPTSRVRPVQAIKKSKKSQVADEAAKRAMRLPEGTGSDRRGNSACSCALGRAEMDLADTASESDSSDPGGMPQLLRRSPAPDTRFQRTQQAAPVPDKPPERNSEFARELASTMSAIASLLVKASGQSVSNGGWLYFSGACEDYRPFRTKCRLFQETYHKVTPQKSLVDMFREWNLAEEVACHIKGAEDMSTVWRMLDVVCDGAPAQTSDQAPEAGRMLEPQEGESEEGSEVEAVSEKQLAPLQARGAAAFRIVDAKVARPETKAANGPQEKHVFIYTLHGIRRLKRLQTSGGKPEHTVVSHEAAQRYGLRADSRRQATWIT